MDGARLLPAEIDRLFASMPGDEATRVLAFADALRAFEAAADKNAAALAIRERFAPLGLKGLSVPSLNRKLADFRAAGVWALVPAKWRREGARGTAANSEALLWSASQGAIGTLLGLDRDRDFLRRLTDEHLAVAARSLAGLSRKAGELLAGRLARRDMGFHGEARETAEAVEILEGGL